MSNLQDFTEEHGTQFTVLFSGNCGCHVKALTMSEALIIGQRQFEDEIATAVIEGWITFEEVDKMNLPQSVWYKEEVQ